MERDKIKLTNEQWCDLVYENYLEIDGVEIKIEEIQRNREASHRHTEQYEVVFKRLDNNKFYKIDYESSVKDFIGWEECNYGDKEAIEVFPKVITTTIYK